MTGGFNIVLHERHDDTWEQRTSKGSMASLVNPMNTHSHA